MIKFFTLPFVVFFFLYNIQSFAQKLDSIPNKEYTARFVTNPPLIDGVLDDEIWKTGEWQGDFVQWIPDEGKRASQSTIFQIAYDKKNLYVAIRAYDEDPDAIDKRLSRRDGFTGDFVEIDLDTYNDKRTGFSFNLNAAGVKGDEAISKNGEVWDRSWNAIWDGKTAIDSEGWTAEFSIPFSQLRFELEDEIVWGMQVLRNDFRNSEFSAWKRFPKSVAGGTFLSGWVANFGALKGIANIEPKKQFEIQPYVVAQADRYEKLEGNPFRNGKESRFELGIDGKIGLMNNMIMDFTVNPDFGQVEADPSRITLDGFQIFFEEQRPFFVENKNIFEYQFDRSSNLFYSRRIGGSPHHRPTTTSGEYLDMPMNTTILGAVKVSGKTENGWSFGLLESITDKMYAKIESNGERREELVEPLSNYTVLRAQKDFNDKKSYVGGIVTSVNRNLDGLDQIVKSAYTAGIDFRHSWQHRKYFVEGHVVGSKLNGSEEAIENLQNSMTHLYQRVDAGHLEVDPNRTSLSGTGGRISGGRALGRWKYFSGIAWKSPGLDLNDIGFLRSSDNISQFNQFSYEMQKANNTFRSIKSELNASFIFDYDGNHNETRFDSETVLRWRNNWFTSFSLGYNPKLFVNSFLRGGPRWRLSDENFSSLTIVSDNSKKISFSTSYTRSRGKENNFSYDIYSIGLKFQPLDALNLELRTNFQDTPSKTQYVGTRSFNGSDRYILGGIDFQNWTTSLRINYLLNPDLSIQYYGQPYMARGKYNDFSLVADAAADPLAERINYLDNGQITFEDNRYLVDENRDGITDYNFYNPDFSIVQFRSNLVIRWEYIPGSELFFVWSQSLSEFGDFDHSFPHNINKGIFKGKPDNTFLIKATYRFML